MFKFAGNLKRKDTVHSKRHTYTHFNDHFLAHPGLSGCSLDSQSVPHPLTSDAILRGFETEVFTGRMTFLSYN